MEIRGLASSGAWLKAWNDNWENQELVRAEVFVAYCSHKGAQEIRKSQAKRNTPLRLVVGADNGVTDIRARDELFAWQAQNPRIEIKTRKLNGALFHPKIYVFDCGDEVRVLLGSVNLTNGAFHCNEEVSVEWRMTQEGWAQSELAKVLNGWWNEKSDPICAPTLEERVLDTMKHGVLVAVEAHLATARFYIPKKDFDVVDDIFVSAGLLRYEQQSKLFVALTGDQVFTNLEGYGQRARDNCKAFSFHTDAGYFVPATAIKDWKAEHRKIEALFRNELTRFSSEQTKAIRENLRKHELPSRLRELCLRLDKQEVSEQKLDQLCAKALAAFDEAATDFPKTIVLSTATTPYRVASSEYSSTNSEVKAVMREFAHRQEEGNLLSWMITLIRDTRFPVVENLTKWLDKPQSKSAEKWRRELGEKLRHLNFYGDEFCNRVQSEVGRAMHHERPVSFKALRRQALADLQATEQWPRMTTEEVLRNFADCAGWEYSSSKPNHSILSDSSLELEF